jgi:hypothetical protein
MQAKRSLKLGLKLGPRDFVYVNDEVIGQSYQNGPYAILVGSRSYYAVTYQGRTIAYNLRCFPAAIEACAKHARDVERKLIPSLYTRRCENTETGFTRHQEGK